MVGSNQSHAQLLNRLSANTIYQSPWLATPSMRVLNALGLHYSHVQILADFENSGFGQVLIF